MPRGRGGISCSLESMLSHPARRVDSNGQNVRAVRLKLAARLPQQGGCCDHEQCIAATPVTQRDPPSRPPPMAAGLPHANGATCLHERCDSFIQAIDGQEGIADQEADSRRRVSVRGDYHRLLCRTVLLRSMLPWSVLSRPERSTHRGQGIRECARQGQQKAESSHRCQSQVWQSARLRSVASDMTLSQAFTLVLQVSCTCCRHILCEKQSKVSLPMPATQDLLRCGYPACGSASPAKDRPTRRS